MLKFKLLLIFLVVTITLNAQTVEPSKSIAKNTFQIEFESIYSIEKDNLSTTKTLSTPNFLFRYGIVKNLELQLSVPIIKETYFNESNEKVYSTHKFDDTQLGFSIDLWSQKKWLPEAAFMTRAYFHYQNSLDFKYVGQTFSLNLSNLLSKKIVLNYNIGYAFEKDTDFSYFIITNLNYNISSNWNTFLEFSGNKTKTKYLQNILIGLNTQISKDLTFDFSFSKGINYSQFYFGGRLTWIIKNKLNQNL